MHLLGNVHPHKVLYSEVYILLKKSKIRYFQSFLSVTKIDTVQFCFTLPSHLK